MKTYECQCHVCGAIHTVEAWFLSTGIIVGADGVQRARYACLGKHTPSEVHAAWVRGGSIPSGVR